MVSLSNIDLISLCTTSIVFVLIIWFLSHRLILGKQINLTRLFLVGTVPFVLLGILVNFVFGNSAFDIQMHDTYFVVAYVHILMGMAVIFAGYAGFYHLFSILFRREMNKTMGKMHFWGTIVSLYAVFLLTFCTEMGMAGVPRRYYQFSNYESFGHFGAINSMIVTLVIAFLLIQIIPFINAVYSLIYGKRIIQ